MHNQYKKRNNTKWKKYKTLTEKLKLLKINDYYETYKLDKIIDYIEFLKQKEKQKYINKK